MAESTPVNLDDPGLKVGSFFLRERNVLMTRADMGPLFVDYYLHLADHKIRHSSEVDALFKTALSGFVLHCASRPWNEMIAWTLHFQEPRINLFLTGDNETGAITGRIFEEDVRDMGENLFYSDVVRGRQPKRRSVAAFAGSDPAEAIRLFYASSEQRGVRLFQVADEEFALLSEHPDCDVEWFRSVDAPSVAALSEGDSVSLMEKRVYRWHCGCNEGRMLEVLSPVYRDDPDGLFAGDESLEMLCPRCAARHQVSREALQRFVQENQS